MPTRPYVLTLHGTDIRRQWADPKLHDELQRAIDGAGHVFYANTDNLENAVAARPDAQFLPSFVDVPSLPAWAPKKAKPIIFFVSRWDEDKGVENQLELVASLHAALAGRADLVGLNWGPGAPEAQRRGVRLLEKCPQAEYHHQLSRASVGIGQASDYFSTSEFEALSMGLPLAALGHRLGRPDDGSVPPAMEGLLTDVVEQVVSAAFDPVATSERLGGASWARARYAADRYVPDLQALYRRLS